MRAISIAAFLLVLCGCYKPDSPKVTVRPTAELNSSRFNVVSAGWFEAGREGTMREILLITDNETKQTYLGITGVGVTELRKVSNGKTSTLKEE